MEDQHLVGDFDRAVRRLQRNLECCERSLVSCCALTVAQADALLVLQERGPVTMNEFASEMKLHGTTMTRMADALVAKGLVQRSEDEWDRRVVRVSLTEHGHETARALRESVGQFYEATLERLSPGDRAVLLRLLAGLSDALEGAGEPCCS